ncbi:restriction endonuclease subunit S [Limosilactobacillus fastidiosus]|uniref:restriction endonuclease subunit S n=1 Tax=Limosilactobacillus fastidiosus TaxID=2759855 RepID=UPI002175C553|nr:restriction endonuclease subunit S [Limosilactobacillus fastidiosus]
MDLLKQLKKGLLQKLFADKDAKQPVLRFDGFSGDWEQRKLGEFGSVAMNKRIFKKQTTKLGDVPFYKIGTFGKKPDAYISNELFEEYKSKYPYPETGDLLISASGSIGRIVEYKGQKAYFQDSNIVWLKHNDQLNNLFLKAFYHIVKWDGTEGSTIKRLYNKNILRTKISLPTVLEQEKIGEIIEHIEQLTALQQSKLDKLTFLKNFLLQQMFI